MIAFDPAPFRDPSGRLFRHDGAIFRTASAGVLASLRAARRSGLLDDLEQQGLFLPVTIVKREDTSLSTAQVGEVLGVIDESGVKGPESGVQSNQVQRAQPVPADFKAAPDRDESCRGTRHRPVESWASSVDGGQVTRDDVQKFVWGEGSGIRYHTQQPGTRYASMWRVCPQRRKIADQQARGIIARRLVGPSTPRRCSRASTRSSGGPLGQTGWSHLPPPHTLAVCLIPALMAASVTSAYWPIPRQSVHVVVVTALIGVRSARYGGTRG